MTKKVIHIAGLEEIEKVAKELLKSCISRKVFAFYGSLGAGKTTLIKAICRELGTNDQLSSPTFSIVNEYRDSDGDPIYHIDLYRLESAEEAMDAGLLEYMDSGYYCFIEWPQIMEAYLPDDYVDVNLEVEQNDTRNLTIKM